ncbi:cobyrinate a,c-diamide synthase [Archaeoglobus sp.]
MDIPRITIAGIKSKVGKTTIAIGLMKALTDRGYVVQPYKVGPDFIDPIFHYFATKRHSRNLDDFMFSKYDILEAFERSFKGADIAVIEGKTGLYDSHNALDEKGSTASIAKILKSPVILVADAERINRSISAMLLGYKLFDRDVNIEGVILNRVGNPRHAEKVRKAVEKLAKMRVVGVIPRTAVDMPYRHLGLVPAHEREEIEEVIEKLAEMVETYVDVDKVVEIAHKAPKLEDVPCNAVFERKKSSVRIGVVRDKPFCFYYQDNIDALSAKAEVVVVDSLKDRKLPEVDALYIGGGFPEVFAESLEKNKPFRKSVYEFCDSGKPVYAECGGLMFLGESIINDEGEFEMVGFLPIKTRMHSKFRALGYCVYRAVKANPISRVGDTIVGHEFHYSEVIPLEKLDFAYRVRRGKGVDGKHDGIIRKNTLANYIHLHVLSYPKMVEKFLKTAEKMRRS